MPTVGTIVHVRNAEGVCLAAIITRVDDAARNVVSLTVFAPSVDTTMYVKAPLENPDGPRVTAWHWPERAE